MLVLTKKRTDTSTPPLAPRPQPDRYEPMPSLVQLPGWIWRRTGAGLRALIALVLLAGVVGAVVVGREIIEDKRTDAGAQRRQEARLRAQRAQSLRAEQRPRFGRSDAIAAPGAPAPRQLAARSEMVNELATAIAGDARRRVRQGALDGSILRADCEPFPRTVEGKGAHESIARRGGRYSCIAVTAEFEGGDGGIGGVLGHQYRALIDFATGRYAFCKVSGQSGPSREQLVTTPRVCGGR